MAEQNTYIGEQYPFPPSCSHDQDCPGGFHLSRNSTLPQYKIPIQYQVQITLRWPQCLPSNPFRETSPPYYRTSMLLSHRLMRSGKVVKYLAGPAIDIRHSFPSSAREPLNPLVKVRFQRGYTSSHRMAARLGFPGIGPADFSMAWEHKQTKRYTALMQKSSGRCGFSQRQDNEYPIGTLRRHGLNTQFVTWKR